MKESSITVICMTVKASYNKCLVHGSWSKNVCNGWKHTANFQSNKSPPRTKQTWSKFLFTGWILRVPAGRSASRLFIPQQCDTKNTVLCVSGTWLMWCRKLSLYLYWDFLDSTCNQSCYLLKLPVKKLTI